jgi:hypothetical protein
MTVRAIMPIKGTHAQFLSLDDLVVSSTGI